MKLRTGFVSNSSSSSFVIPISCLTVLQKIAIKDYIYMAKLIEAEKPGTFGYIEENEDCPEWSITIDDYAVQGFTYMDNFDMYTFLHEIGIPASKINCSDHDGFDPEDFDDFEPY